MRISNKQVYLMIQRNIDRPKTNFLGLHEKLSSGRDINRFSDNPYGAGQVEKIRAQLSKIEQYQRNIESGLAVLNQTESAQDRVESQLIRAKELAVTGASSAKNSSDRIAIAEEVNQILENVLSISNLKFRDTYLFAGVNTTEKPYTELRDANGDITAVTFNADSSGEIRHEVADGTYVTVNTPGSNMFNLKDGPIAALIELRDDLLSNDIPAIRSSHDKVGDAFDNVLNEHIKIGSKTARISRQSEQYSTLTVDLTAYLSKIQDADIAELAVQLGMNEVVQRAAVGAASRIVQTNLVDLLT